MVFVFCVCILCISLFCSLFVLSTTLSTSKSEGCWYRTLLDFFLFIENDQRRSPRWLLLLLLRGVFFLYVCVCQLYMYIMIMATCLWQPVYQQSKRNACWFYRASNCTNLLVLALYKIRYPQLWRKKKRWWWVVVRTVVTKEECPRRRGFLGFFFVASLTQKRNKEEVKKLLTLRI